MSYLYYVLIFLFGSVIGSFLNVIILRLRSGQVCRPEKKESIIHGRSHCLKCGKTLAWYDLVPVVSFLWLSGKCRSCKEKISWQYPLVEIAAGLSFVLIFYSNYELRITNYGYELSVFSMIHDSLFMIQLLSHWFIISCLIAIFVYDLRHYIIPDIILFPAIVVSFLWRVFEVLLAPSGVEGGLGHFFPYLLSALGASAFFLAIILITRGKGMGLGDAKLTFLMGLLLGWPNILAALFLAFFIGATVGVGLIFWGGKNMKSQIPFGPFLIAATTFVLFFGEKVWGCYSGLLGF